MSEPCAHGIRFDWPEDCSEPLSTVCTRCLRMVVATGHHTAELERARIVAYLRRDGACDCELDPDFAGAQHGSILRCMSCLIAEELEKGEHV